MGNEKSVPKTMQIQVEEEIIEITEEWIQKCATTKNGVETACVFEKQLTDSCTLQKLSKNLMVFRHPNILKFIVSWQKDKTLYVATEYAKPLTLVLTTLSPLQLCVGLFNILKAIMFLHEDASSSHNNISKEAVYVTPDGCWKLGRCELLTKLKDVNKTHLDRYRLNVDQSSIDLENNPEFVDLLGFDSLVQEVLNQINEDELPSVEEFRICCRESCLSEAGSRQTFFKLAAHSFFNNPFIDIYSFLIELPAKNETEKTEFFKTVADKLLSYSEELVAFQFGKLLLSRLVLLNTSAQSFLLPKLFNPQNDHNPSSLFTESTLQKYILPHLTNIFRLRDAQIRLILLQHFNSFYSLYSKDQLQTKILPELLVGIKDTNDQLVAATLRTLADLVSVLGASVVIGKGRSKLFADGRPTVKSNKSISEKGNEDTDTPFIDTCIKNTTYVIRERLSPDGGEDAQETISIANENEDDLPVIETLTTSPVASEFTEVQPSLKLTEKTKMNVRWRAKVEENLAELDVKSSRPMNHNEQDDIDQIFKDMEPVILKTEVYEVNDAKRKFEAPDILCEDGWGDETTWTELNQLVDEKQVT